MSRKIKKWKRVLKVSIWDFLFLAAEPIRNNLKAKFVTFPPLATPIRKGAYKKG